MPLLSKWSSEYCFNRSQKSLTVKYTSLAMINVNCDAHMWVLLCWWEQQAGSEKNPAWGDTGRRGSFILRMKSLQNLVFSSIINRLESVIHKRWPSEKVFDAFCHCPYACLWGVFSKWSCFKGQWSLPQISRVDFVFVIVNVFWLVMSCLIITLIKCLKKAKSIKDCSENVYYKNICAHMWLVVISTVGALYLGPPGDPSIPSIHPIPPSTYSF